MEIYVCIGSSCHLKGSYKIINAFQSLIAEHQLGDQVNLNASFCLGHCRDGISIKIDDKIVGGVNADNVKDIFHDTVLKELL
ncbi:(2Fe-2S) ferredoxin domain-containing protein [Oscillospiraceae bacterium PP1C4]